VLEDTVSRLEARLLELENPEASTPSVLLHDPYRGYSQRVSTSPPVHVPEASLVFGQLSPFSPTSTTSSLSSGRHWQSFSALEANTESTGSSGSSTSPIRLPIAMPFPGYEEPSLVALQTSIDTFIPHAQQYGFFLHIPTFRQSALLAFPLGHPSRPTPGLLHAVHLMGVHFSQPESQQDQESALLMKAVQHVSTDLLGSHPNKVLQTLQAQILLTYYFFRVAAILEAKVHTSAAVSLALGSGLHRIRSSSISAPATIAIVQDQPYALPPPASGLQEAERINAFWSVLMLHKFVTVSLENPANVCGALEAPGMQIDTPWPVSLDNFKEGMFPPEFQTESTVRTFLNGFLGDIGAASSLEMAAKAAILFHRSAHVSGQWKPNLEPRERAAYEAAARSMNMLIDLFRKQLPPLPEFNTQDPDLRMTILTHALIDAAAIKLHWLFAYAWSTSRQICLAAARNLVSYKLNLQELGHFNPIMGNLWMTACHVFIDEISRVRHNKELYPGVEDELMDSYRNGLNVMSLFAQEGKLMQYQLSKVHDSFAAI